ncbi:hypothetical protein [Amycolatopsis cihanbeyliensis]|uniref:Regulator of septum formation n=1 Tax=Amycolatopsis cihanbeyliensis TaxID=1128664 RepID=A0A542DJM7_AMYCI|nr:hypothetical protein [Amycolatopsis cihanbeyliensis]TQJ03293.1 hypothetical protein FB471_3049 [Amycolatopsis cihanbeyliensis]
MTKRAGWLLACCLGLLVHTACSDEGTPVEAVQSGQPERSAPERPKDRNAAALGAALGALDTCALLGKGKSEPGRRACSVTGGDNETVEVKVGEWPPRKRWSALPIELAGKRAYQLRHQLSHLPMGCSMAAPLSFRIVVEFEYRHVSFGPEQEDHCARLRGVAEDGMRRLIAIPGMDGFLFAPEENDTGALGACVHLDEPGAAEECEPARPVRVPEKVDRLLALGSADPNVACAAFAGAVRRLHGTSLKPVVHRGICHFVQAGHRVQLDAGFGVLDSSPAECGTPAERFRDRAETTLGGRPAVTFRTRAGSSYHLCVSPHGDLRRAGTVSFGVTVLGERGVQTLSEPALPEREADKAHAVVAHMLAEHAR